MRLVFHGGFGEKGRTCIGVEVDGYRLLLDAGVKTSASGRDYYPDISQGALRATDAIVITHAHEDHVGALGWCLANGFDGRIFMTTQTRTEAALCLASYAEPDHAALVEATRIELLPVGDVLAIGPLGIRTGRSGHIGGGVWCVLDGGDVTFGYCGDVVPASRVFTFDPLPSCTVVALDASYGDDTKTWRERADAIVAWVTARPEGCVLPTPLSGRSAELLAIVEQPMALCPGMRDGLRAQLADATWLESGAAALLERRLDAAVDWQEDTALPRAPLLCHDGMGLAGPSREILRRALHQPHPTLFTGHLPTDSPGERMVAGRHADWIRLPTHPNLHDNIAIARSTRAAAVLGHSCERDALERMREGLPTLRTDIATGDSLDL